MGISGIYLNKAKLKPRCSQRRDFKIITIVVVVKRWTNAIYDSLSVSHYNIIIPSLTHVSARILYNKNHMRLKNGLNRIHVRSEALTIIILSDYYLRLV